MSAHAHSWNGERVYTTPNKSNTKVTVWETCAGNKLLKRELIIQVSSSRVRWKNPMLGHLHTLQDEFTLECKHFLVQVPSQLTELERESIDLHRAVLLSHSPRARCACFDKCYFTKSPWMSKQDILIPIRHSRSPLIFMYGIDYHTYFSCRTFLVTECLCFSIIVCMFIIKL